MSDGFVGHIEVGGAPSEAEIAAIIAAVEMAWPKPQSAAQEPRQTTVWRHADRWWAGGRLPSKWNSRG
jgi:hypothetical protein